MPSGSVKRGRRALLHDESADLTEHAAVKLGERHGVCKTSGDQAEASPMASTAWSMKARTRGARCRLAGQMRLAVAPSCS